MFVCVFSGRVRGWLRGGLFDVHRILILVPFCIFYSDVFDVPSLRVHFSRCWRHDTSCHFYRGPRWLLNSPRCSTAERSGLVRPGGRLRTDLVHLFFLVSRYPERGLSNSPLLRRGTTFLPLRGTRQQRVRLRGISFGYEHEHEGFLGGPWRVRGTILTYRVPS